MSHNSEGNTDVRRASFWISQIVIIIATVCGVFLAASQGLKQAIQFDNIRSQQNNYYLRKSLQNELSDNVGYIREYQNKVKQRVVKPDLKLETFVWNSMTYSPASLETPSDLLREAQKFYHTAADIMANPHFNDMNRSQALGELADHIEQDVLLKFDMDTNKLKTNLKNNGIDI